MFELGPLAFSAPWALAALGLLPLLWLLLRLTPPAPRRHPFPPLRLLLGLKSAEESAMRPPWWLVLLRVLLVVLLVLAASGPVIQAGQTLRGTGPVVLVIDDGWAAAGDWNQRKAAARGLLAEADRTNRSVALITTARRSGAPPPLRLMRASEAQERLATLTPKPWGTDRLAALAPLAELPEGPPGHALWLADGLDADGEEGTVWAALRKVGVTSLLRGEEKTAPLILHPPRTEGEDLRVTARRLPTTTPRAATLRAFAVDGALLAETSLDFAAGEGAATATLSLPAELRGRLARLEVADAGSAAAVVIVDERWRRRPVGVVSAETEGGGTLLSGTHYVTRALEALTEVRQGTVEDLLARELAMLVLVDPGPLGEAGRKRLREWMEAGGVVLRFAGPRLARTTGNGGDDLLPVRLRFGGRQMGGALSWRRPAEVAPFAADGPLHGLTVPRDLRVRRQVLAEPSPGLEETAWARLADGTPLVTAEKRGRGRLILVHTAADPAWSNLPLTGLFPALLSRVLDMARGVEAGAAKVPLAAIETLDGFGNPVAPPPGTRALPAPLPEELGPGPEQPPGLYGSGAVRRAFNLAPPASRLVALDDPPPAIENRGLDRPPETDLTPWLVAGALALAMLDLLAGLGLRGLLTRGSVLGMMLGLAVPAQAGDEGRFLEATRDTVLAYRLTGDAETDRISRAGLFGLGTVVNRRTAARMGKPMGIDPETDELSFHPLIYWPLVEGAQPLSDKGAARVRAYLHKGGMILFDRRGGSGGGDGLGELAESLGIPPLVRLPGDHVLTRAYYLLDHFPGRWRGGSLWIEPAGERVNDGVPPVIAGDNDWAGAWAVDEGLVPLFPVVPDGERQREIAYRFGINLVMMALTGNYKADQVHMPAILERLGR